MARTARAAEASPETKSRRSWAPDHEDHFIFWWVKLQGQTQAYVASQLGLSQGTVSRTIKRYERWQTRSEAQADGRLSHAERLRAQRWLTYERNELILASCLRIAGEMESTVDVTTRTLQRPHSQPGADREVRTTFSAQDRHGIAARFLRLAYRINMDNLKLVQQDELPPLDPLSPEQLAAEEAAAEQLRAERQSAKSNGLSYYDEQRERARQRQAELDEQDRQREEQFAAAARLKEREEAERQALAEELLAQESASAAAAEETEVPSYQVSTNSPAASDSAPSAHKAHNDAPENHAATADRTTTYAKNGRPEKTPRHARMNGRPAERSRQATRKTKASAAPLAAENAAACG